MAKGFILTAGIFLSLMFAGQVRADPSAADVISHYNDPKAPHRELISYYVSGVFSTMIWMNTYAERQLGQLVYCAPVDVQKTTSLMMNEVIKYVEDNPSVKNFPFGAVATSAFINTYPCKKK